MMPANALAAEIPCTTWRDGFFSRRPTTKSPVQLAMSLPAHPEDRDCRLRQKNSLRLKGDVGLV
jgi:hypothetical protein